MLGVAGDVCTRFGKHGGAAERVRVVDPRRDGRRALAAGLSTVTDRVGGYLQQAWCSRYPGFFQLGALAWSVPG